MKCGVLHSRGERGLLEAFCIEQFLSNLEVTQEGNHNCTQETQSEPSPRLKITLVMEPNMPNVLFLSDLENIRQYGNEKICAFR